MKKLLPIICLCLLGKFSIAQQAFTQQELDSIAFRDSVIAELKLLLALGAGSSPYSYADVSVGLGNAFFTPKKTTLNKPASKIYYSTSLGYYHKSGVNMVLQGSFIPQNGKLSLFQTSISPGYNYTKSKKIGFGVAYFHYFTKDSLSFYTSPLVNEFFAYAKYKGGWLVPKLSLDYGFGKEVLHPRPNYPNVTVTNKVSDFSILASAEHIFSYEEVFSKKDGFVFTPSLSLIMGTSNYGTNLSLGNIANPRLNRIAQNYNQKSKTGFLFQSINLNLNSEYDLGKFYIQPQMIVYYVLPAAQSRYSFMYSISLGAYL